MTVDEIADTADQANQLGTLWVLLTDGEPLLRPDFAEIYLMPILKGLLISVFTNATLIREEHIQLFTKYPPRDMEISIYGGDQATYEAVTRTPGSFKALLRGLDALFQAGIRPHLKAMAMHANFQNLQSIPALSQAHSDEYCRFGPVRHLRYDRDEGRNQEIRAQRLGKTCARCSLHPYHNQDYLNACGKCPIVNLCLNCPAHAFNKSLRILLTCHLQYVLSSLNNVFCKAIMNIRWRHQTDAAMVMLIVEPRNEMTCSQASTWLAAKSLWIVRTILHGS